jgi:hypothetical protein
MNSSPPAPTDASSSPGSEVPQGSEGSEGMSPPCRRVYGPLDTRGCSCRDCEIYFNISTKRPIINVSPEDYHRVMKRFYDPEMSQRRSRYRPCPRHHHVETVLPTDALTDLPTRPGPIVCSIEYVIFAGFGEMGRQCIQVCYRYPKCQVKCEFTLKPDDEVDLYAWGHCRAQ